MNTSKYKKLTIALVNILEGIEKDHKQRAWRNLGWAVVKERIQWNFFKLEKRDQKLLTLRYGLEDGIVRTLKEVGKELKISRQRVMILQKKGLRKLLELSTNRKWINLT